MFWKRPDNLSLYAGELDWRAISSLRTERQKGLESEAWQVCLNLLQQFPEQDKSAISFNLADSIVQIGQAGELSPDHFESLIQILKVLMPWRKGPFNFFGEVLDAEWRSDLKWNRIQNQLGDLANKRVLDIGCNNGYYMIRMLERDPRLVYGIDPAERTWYQFEFLQSFIQDPRLQYDLFGIEDLHLFPNFFDLVLCMGILYHRRDPLLMLDKVREVLRPGGVLILENIVIKGDAPNTLCIADRYCQMRNVYFVPTVSALEAWLKRAGFVDIEVFDITKTELNEQRKTEYAPFQSLEDFLDPEDSELTIEGWPAPYRACIRARARS